MHSPLMSETIYTEERHGKSRKVPRNTKLIEAFQFKANMKCIVLTVSFVLSVLWQIKFTNDNQRHPATPVFLLINMFNKMVVLVVYMMLLDECYLSTTRRDLCDMKLMGFSDASKYMKRLRIAEPIVWWKVTCYHYKHGVKVISKVVYVKFSNRLLQHRDISDIVVFDQSSPLVKISLTKGFMFGSRKRASQYHYARMAFFSDYEHSDTRAEKLDGVELLSRNTVFHDVVWAGRVPRFFNQLTYWLFSCLLLSWPYRVYFNYVTATVNVGIKKTFGRRRTGRRRRQPLRNVVYRPRSPGHWLSNIGDLFSFGTGNEPDIYELVPLSPNFRLPESRCRCEYDETGDYFVYHCYSDLGRYDLAPSYMNALEAAVPLASRG